MRGPTPVLATAVSLTEVYTLSALDDGRVVCSPCGDARCLSDGIPRLVMAIILPGLAAKTKS